MRFGCASNRLLKNSPQRSFRGAAAVPNEVREESRVCHISRARFLAPLGITRPEKVLQQPAKRQARNGQGTKDKGRRTPSAGFTLLELMIVITLIMRSEERRVGKECRSRWSPYH